MSESIVPGLADGMVVFVPSLAPGRLVVVPGTMNVPAPGLEACVNELLQAGHRGLLEQKDLDHLRFGSPTERHDRNLDWRSAVFAPMSMPGHAWGAIVYWVGPTRHSATKDVVDTLLEATDLCAGMILSTALGDHRLFDRDIAGTLSDAVIAVDPEFTVIRWNPAAERLYGIANEDAIGSPLGALYSTFYDDPEMDRDKAWEQLQRTGRWEGHVTQQSKAGRTVSVFAAVSAVRDDNGRLIGAVAVNRDNSDIMLARSRIDNAERMLSGALDAAGAMTVILDHHGRIVAANREWLDMGLLTGARMDYVSVGADYLGPVRRAVEDDEPSAADALSSLEAVLSGRAAKSTCEYRCDRPDGPTWYQLEVTSLGDSGGAVVTHREITQRHRLESLLAHHDTHDSLTGLGNRHLLESRVARTVTARGADRVHLGLILCDVDEFVSVNEELGYRTGDEVLRIVANRIQEVCPPTYVAARIGGDQFAILTDSLDEASGLPGLAERIRESMSGTIEVAGRHLSLSVSVGYASVSTATSDLVPDLASELIGRADAARVDSKARGRNRVRPYRPDLRDRTSSTLQQRHEFATALQRGDLELHYQQIRRLSDDVVVGFEGLVRWPCRGGPVLTPATFAAAIDAPIVAGPLARWCIHTAVRDAQILADAFSAAPTHVGINMSAQQFLDLDVATVLESTVARAGLDPSAIVIEVTETTTFTDDRRVLDQLAHLTSCGFPVALDDFGTGFSSLQHLRELPVNAVKVDRSFTAGVGSERTSDALVRSLIALAHDLELWVVAEGVETAAQRDWLADAGCDFYQGFLAHRPARLADVLASAGD